MINSVLVTLTKPDNQDDSVPTFILFSTAPHEDNSQLTLFTPVIVSELQGENIALEWLLPDPDISLGQVNIARHQAPEFQAKNRAFGGVQLMLVEDVPGTTEQIGMTLKPFYVDWFGRLAAQNLSIESENDLAPVTGAGKQHARLLRQEKRYSEAAQALLDEIALLGHPDGSLQRHAAYTLHEAALLAEAGGLYDAWEYFETVALTVYPNCHDALIGLALRAKDKLAQALPFLARAYAIRPQQKDLRLYVKTFARRTRKDYQILQNAIVKQAATVNLAGPMFADGSGEPLHVSLDEVTRHLEALQRSLA